MLTGEIVKSRTDVRGKVEEVRTRKWKVPAIIRVGQSFRLGSRDKEKQPELAPLMRHLCSAEEIKENHVATRPIPSKACEEAMIMMRGISIFSE